MSKLETAQQSAAQSNRKMLDALTRAEEAEMLTTLASQLAAHLEGHLAGALAASEANLSARLDHIEKNLIVQQPSVREFTRQVYPHIEATIKRCEATEERQTKLEESLRQTEEALAGFAVETEETLARQQKENNDLFLQTQTKIVNEYRGYQQLIHKDLESLRQTERSCQAMVAECKRLAEQFGRPYEAASGALQELTETAKTRVREAAEEAVSSVEQARAKFVRTLHCLDTTLTSHPFLVIGCLLMTAVIMALLTSLTINKLLTERMVSRAAEASTARTVESLEPLLEKLQDQTNSLAQTRLRSESWDYYLSTLPRDQAQQLRARVQQQVIERGQKTAREHHTGKQ